LSICENKIGVTGVERVVEIKHPFGHMGEVSGGGKGHAEILIERY
jgi:hypothetical protein